MRERKELRDTEQQFRGDPRAQPKDLRGERLATTQAGLVMAASFRT